MNVLKKSTLALAIAGFASAASAATISPDLQNTYTDMDHWVLSNEGLEVGQYHKDVIKFDLKVENAHESRYEFDIVLPESISLQDLSLAPITPLKLFQNASGDNFYVSNNNNTDSDIVIRVGTGSFSVESAKFNSTNNTLTLVSGVGQSLLPGSSIGIQIGTIGQLVRVKGAADIVVNTYTETREFIETASRTFATTADQFELTLREGTSELVDRVDNSYFASEVYYNDDRVVSATHGSEDRVSINELYQDTNEGVIRLTNDQHLVARAIADDVDIQLYADFNAQGPFATAHSKFVFGGDDDGAVVANSTVATFNVEEAETTLATAKNDIRLAFDNSTAPVVSNLENEFKIGAVLNYSGNMSGAQTASNVTLDTTAFGEWILNQAIINVPYMPIGYKAKGIDAVFEIANRGWADAPIKVKGFDQHGNVFPATPLVDAGKQENGGVASAQTIVKVSADDILATFGLEEGDQRKMNITFMIDANRADIDLVPYYNNNGGRTPIMNSQYKDGADR
ncbi:hypothetical protein DA096_15350 [Vibrio rotiferianus]|uniref:hypothetical protein n=1 Tax=Vibrio rotiferianus TaxID=190895 RepID=UPI001110C550|nr:hypothetical protein [Vibrio rotiferianus]TMX44371.1 hypothetical protein DA095_00800 [Vibrio rotiferianus]TMX48766.1 hypothetical protein DA093_15870 [Vibrio rotiferianus]TMX61992.1 hypothetical protein DA096_15350 [Vibrio rotiferianus]